MIETFKIVRLPEIAKVAFAAAACCAAFASPAGARESSGRDIVINIGKDGDLLEQLIELDKQGIEDLRAEMAEARADVAEAIAEIDEAREEVKSVPGGRLILKIAFASARAGASTAIEEALGDARREIDRAEQELKTAEVDAEELAETQTAIDVLREEINALEASLNELLSAMNG